MAFRIAAEVMADTGIVYSHIDWWAAWFQLNWRCARTTHDIFDEAMQRYGSFVARRCGVGLLHALGMVRLWGWYRFFEQRQVALSVQTGE